MRPSFRFGRLARRITAALLLAASAHPAGAQTADLILTNARVYTVEEDQPWAQSVAISDGRIVAVGSDAETARLKGAATQVVDLRGRLVLPAFGDAHAHPLFGGLSRTRCPLHDGKTIEDYQRLIARCVQSTPGEGAIYGVGWQQSLFPPKGVPRKELLDAVSTTRPLIFESVDGHSFWLNSRALAVGKITRDTPDPPNGSIDRDPTTGEPVGALQESAMKLVEDLIPPPSPQEIQDSILYVNQLFNSLGIVSWNDAGVNFDDKGGSPMVDAYKAVMDAGRLTSHVAVSLKWENERGVEQLPALFRAAERANAMGVSTKTVKFYVDGVIPQRTAYMLAPYEGGTARGNPQIDPDVLKAAAVAIDARGMTGYFHAIGDGAVRVSLDAIEAARKANGAKPTPHMITHLNIVDPADQPRFGALDTFAQFQPSWASWYPYMELTEQAVGAARMRHVYPAGSILRSGGKLAYGADWPVDSADPLIGLEVAVTRRTPGTPDARPLVESEGVTLAQAIESHTINAAMVNGFDRVTGSIAPGKSADLVVLDRDLFKLPAHEIAKAKVLVTLFKGRAVHGDLANLSR